VSTLQRSTHSPHPGNPPVAAKPQSKATPAPAVQQNNKTTKKKTKHPSWTPRKITNPSSNTKPPPITEHNHRTMKRLETHWPAGPSFLYFITPSLLLCRLFLSFCCSGLWFYLPSETHVWWLFVVVVCLDGQKFQLAALRGPIELKLSRDLGLVSQNSVHVLFSRFDCFSYCKQTNKTKIANIAVLKNLSFFCCSNSDWFETWWGHPEEYKEYFSMFVLFILLFVYIS
jgi:hypothetical protein